MVLGASARIVSMIRPMLASSSIRRVGVVAEMRPAANSGAGVGRVVHLDEVDVHEERLVVLRMRLDVVDRRVGLPDVEGRQVVIVDGAGLLGGLAGDAFPLAQVHELVVHLR